MNKLDYIIIGFGLGCTISNLIIKDYQSMIACGFITGLYTGIVYMIAKEANQKETAEVKI